MPIKDFLRSWLFPKLSYDYNMLQREFKLLLKSEQGYRTMVQSKNKRIYELETENRYLKTQLEDGESDDISDEV